MKKTTKFLMAALPVALAVQASAQTSAVTLPVGYSSTTLGGQFNFIAVNLTNRIESQQPLDATLSGTFTAGQFDAGSFPRYYAEIGGGANEGARIDIASNTATALTLMGDAAEVTAFTGLLDGVAPVIIRKHVTLTDALGGDGTAAPADLQIDPGSDATSADQVLFFDGSSFVTAFYSNFFASPGWTDGATDVSEAIIAPGEGIIVVDSNGDNDQITVVGHVKASKTLIDLQVGFNLVAFPVPLDRPISGVFGGATDESDLQLASGADAASADNVLVFTDGSFTTLFYSNFFASPGWSPSDLPLNGATSLFVEIKAANGPRTVEIDLFDEAAGVAL